MFTIYKYIFFIFTFLFFTNVIALETDWSSGIESQVRIISPISQNNKSDLVLGLEYKMLEGWKTYWQSPGDGGFPQNIIWNKSSNVKSLEILWPTPKEFEILGIKSIGYSDKVIFPIAINVKDKNLSTKVIIDLNYLVCKDICIPGIANLELIIPPAKGKLTQHFFILEKSLSKLPITALDVNLINYAKTNIFIDKKNINITLSLKTKNFFKKPSIFLHTKYGLPVISPIIKLSANSKNLKIEYTFKKDLIKDSEISTEFVISDQGKSFSIEEITTVQKSSGIRLNTSKTLILFIAFLGGLILNAMPCVLPILSIKVLSMLQNINSPNSIRKSFFITSLGIIFSFILLSFIFIFLRYLGVGVGWGMQFQQPYFLLLIAIVLIFFSLNLLGLFEIQVPKFLNNKKIIKLNNSNMKDFFNGFFVTVMATPCSAPFVGTAITAAFTQSYLMMFSIFLFMSIGMSSPYLLVSSFPILLNFFPKPGKWMIILKYLLGMMLFGTLIWISTIILNHFNYYFLLSSVAIFLTAFVIIKFIDFKKTTIIFASLIFFSLPNYSFFKSNYFKTDTDWLDFNIADLQNLADTNILFVDITADWCATCQYNKINVLNSKKIKEKFDEYNIIRVRGDWTKPNKKIQNFLQKYQKYGIPFNIIYNKNYPDGIILSELLNEKEVIKLLSSLN